MSPADVLVAEKEDLIALGVLTVGARARLKKRCREFVELNQSGVPKKVTARDEVLRLFAARRGNTATATNIPKEKKPSRSRPKYNKKQSWTHKYFCLASKDKLTLPTSQTEKNALYQAGLGEKVIVIENYISKSEAEYVNELYKAYPKLKNGGGFELMCLERGSKELQLIIGPYKPMDLKCRIGAAKLVIRPIQKSLSLEPYEKVADESDCDIECHICLKQFPLSLLRTHIKEDHPGSSSDHSEDDEDGLPKMRTKKRRLTFGSSTSGSDVSELPPSVCITSHGTSASDQLPELTASTCISVTASNVQIPSPSPSLSLPRTVSLVSASLSSAQSAVLSTSTVANSFIPQRPETQPLGTLYYQNFIDLTEDIHDPDYSDIELEQAIANSLANVEDVVQENSRQEDISLETILTELSSVIDDDKISIFNINRRRVWEGAVRGLLRKTYSPTTKMSVHFSDNLEQPEGAIDQGGPKREFLRLVVDELRNRSIFEGPDYSKNLSCNAGDSALDRYFLVGRMLAVAVVHGGPAPSFFSKKLFYSIVKGPLEITWSVEDIGDYDIRSQIQKIMDAEVGTQELMTAIDEASSFLSLAGCLRVCGTKEAKNSIVQAAIGFYTCGRNYVNYMRLIDGFKTLNLLDAMRKSPTIFEEIFCCAPKKLTVQDVKSIFDIKFSQGNRKMVEENVVSYWMDYIQDVVDGECETKCLEDILIFSTGASREPPLGLTPRPSLQFLHPAEFSDRSCTPSLPEANTCANILWIPVVHDDYDTFKEKMDYGILNAQCFGQA